MIKHATAILILSACTPPMAGGVSIAPNRQPERPAQHIYIPEDYDVRFIAESGDTITLILYPDGDPVQRCLDYGGEPNYNPFTTIYSCDDVDF